MTFNKSFLIPFISINLYLSLLISIYLHQSLLISKTPGQVAGSRSTSSSVDVSLSVGEYRFTLFGYSSPRALITFSGMGIFDQTYADEKGYFEFKNRFSPFSPREACLTAQDQLGRLTSPVCLPPFPTNYNLTIGPVIMPPTLSLDKNNYYIGDEVILTGQTIPNTQVNLSMFSNEKGAGKSLAKKWEMESEKLDNDVGNGKKNRTSHLNNPASHFSPLISRLIKPVEAFSFPQLETISDDKGNFSIALPSSSAKTFRLFAQTNYQKNQSPESRKLTVKVLPWWMIIIQVFLIIFEIIKSRLLELVILLQIIGLGVYFLRRYLHPKTLSIVRREGFLLMRRRDLQR